MTNIRPLHILFQVFAVFVFGVLDGAGREGKVPHPALAAVRVNLETGARPVRILCFGDSVTGLYYHTGGERTYTDLLGIGLKQVSPHLFVMFFDPE